ncbi:UNVERIFIED_CONTAM: hypothetical protein Scaly_2292000 [Sesamum calycinum]|uniref:MULE transposase domain-containing protein n=1 Tax=Sesamum calycinum TaxID=2727403 RepID=A0AAW2MAT0_9LAMI
MGWRLREGESEIATGRVAPDYGFYVGGKIDHFDYCHVDEMSLIELTEMAKTLQIDTHVTFFYSRNGINDCNSIAMMSTDLHTLELVNYVDGDRIVGIFIDHGHGHGTPSEGDSSRRLPDIEEGLEYMGDDIEGDMNEEKERQRVEKSEAQNGLVDSELGIGDNESDFGIEVNWDGNNCMYPFAYAVVEKEKKSTWLWFLELLMNDLEIPTDSDKWTIMSDKQKGLIDAVDMLLPYCEHRFCVMHLYNNFKLAHKGLGLKMMLWKAAKATRVVDFEKIMNELRGKDLEAFKWLAKRPAAQWSRSYFRCNAKCDILLNNMCESFNATIVEARSRPIVDMLETIRMMLMKRVYVKRDQIKKHKGKLTPNIQKLIEELKKKSMEYIAHWNGKDQFEEVAAYWNPMCTCNFWHVFHGKNGLIQTDQHYCLQSGRPKKQDRRKTLDEMKNKKDEVTNCGEKRGKLGRQGLVMTCKTCHVAGHNKRTCPQNRKNKQPEEHVEVPPGFKPKKEKRKADVLSQESKLTTSRRPLTRSVAAVEVLPLSQSSVTGPGTPSKTRKKMMVISKAKQGRHNSPSTQQKKKKKTIENVAAASPSKNAASADPSKITVPASLSKTAASASPSKAPILASHSKTTAPASLSKTAASASHSKAPISASHSKTTASAGHAASPSPSTAANQDIHFELPPGCSQQ